MLIVPVVHRNVVDSWFIESAGLPARVVHCASEAGLKTIGELRAVPERQLRTFRSLGRISVQHIRQFFKLCQEAEEGRLRFESLENILRLFLEDDEYRVLIARYGMNLEKPLVTRSTVTLQEVGRAEGKTRERIRQIQDNALTRLNSALPRLCLQPVLDEGLRLLEKYQEVITASDLVSEQNPVLFSGHNPCGVFLLLCDIQSSPIHSVGEFFASKPPEAITRLLKDSLSVLAEARRPMAKREIMERLASAEAFPTPEQACRAATVALDHEPLAGGTLDGRFFHFERGFEAFLLEVMKHLPLPVHYRTLTQALNERLKPRSGKGAGFVLEALNASSACARADRGLYGLRGKA